MNHIIVDVDTVLWQPGSEWTATLEHIATRFARIRELDVPAVSQLDVAAACDAIAAWAGDDIDWARELTRFFDEHLSLYLRADPVTSRQIRSLAADGCTITAASALPEPAAKSLLRQRNMLRGIALVAGSVTTPAAWEALIASTNADTVASTAGHPWPEGVEVRAGLASATSQR